MNLERRLERLESAIADKRQDTPDPVDLSRLTEDEQRTIETLAATACEDGHTWDLSKLADSELRTLKEVVKKARTGDEEECS